MVVKVRIYERHKNCTEMIVQTEILPVWNEISEILYVINISTGGLMDLPFTSPVCGMHFRV